MQVKDHHTVNLPYGALHTACNLSDIESNNLGFCLIEVFRYAMIITTTELLWVTVKPYALHQEIMFADAQA